MQRIEDVLTGLMMIGSTLIVFAIISVGAFLLLRRSGFISLTILFAVGFLSLYTLRSIYIGFNLIFRGRYRDEMTVRDNWRYSA